MLQIKPDFDLGEGELTAMDTKELRDHGQWAIALVVAGVAMSVASIASENKDAFLVALGITLYGVGQMRNRQIQQAVQFDSFGRPVGTITHYPHRFTLIGTILSVGGAVLFGLGLYRFIFEH